MTVFDLDIIVRISLGARSHRKEASWKLKLQASRFKGVTQLYAQTNNSDQKRFCFGNDLSQRKVFNSKPASTLPNLTHPHP